jgi:hypothetical protein
MAEPRSDPQTAGHRSAAPDARAITLPKRIPELLYGAVVTGSILAVSSLHGSSSEHVAIATGVVAIVYWLAHVYVDAVGGRFHDLEHSTLERLGEALRTNTEVLVGSLPPIAVFLVARILGAEVETAAEIALWFTVAILTCAGATAAFLAGVRGWRLVLETAVAGCFGLVVILLKYLLH